MKNNLLIKLIKRAQGELSQNEFAKKCDISSSNLTRIYRGDQQPSPALLKKIADNSLTNVQYENLMIAAGYWEESRGDFYTPMQHLFNYRLRKLRTEKDLTIEQLSSLTGISASVIQDLEDEKPVEFNRLQLSSLAQALETDVFYLTGESMYETPEIQEQAFKEIHTMSDTLDTMDESFRCDFVSSINNLLESLKYLEKNNGDPVLPNFKFGLIEILNKLNKLYGLYNNYRNLYHKYQLIKFEETYKFPHYISDINDLDSQSVQLLSLSANELDYSLTLQTKEVVNDIEKILLNECNSIFEQYYLSVLKPDYEKNQLEDKKPPME